MFAVRSTLWDGVDMVCGLPCRARWGVHPRDVWLPRPPDPCHRPMHRKRGQPIRLIQRVLRPNDMRFEWFNNRREDEG